ncbi:TPA: hypothetical protein DCE37_15165 [Candidatus Latescibacteria bacterium]|nr:hypothetical protein [Candidatus Latescibacterota bacterium]
MSILVAGNAVLDVQLAVDDDQGFEDGFSGRNVGFLSQPPNVVLGGNGAATAYALGRMGIPVTLNTTLGEDPAGDLIRSWLTQAEVSLAAPSSSSSAVHVLRIRASDGARSTSFFTGKTIDWSVGTDGLQSGWFFAAGYGGVAAEDFDALIPVLERVRANRNAVVFDPGPWFAASVSVNAFREALKFVNCLTGTEEELETWSSKQGADELIDDYLGLGPDQVIVKQGSRGASFATRAGERGHVAAQPVEAAHAVGAGDTFNGALLAGLYEGRGFEACVGMGVTRATTAVASGRGVLGAFD